MESMRQKPRAGDFDQAVEAFLSHGEAALEAPHESLVRKGSITKEGLRRLSSLPFEISMRDHGDDIILSSGAKTCVHDFADAKPGTIEYEVGGTIEYEMAASRSPLHTHPTHGMRLPSPGDLVPMDIGHAAHKAVRDPFAQQYKIAWIAAEKGLIAYRRATREEYSRIDYLTKLFIAEHPELIAEHRAASAQGDRAHPSHEKITKEMLSMLQGEGVVYAEMDWDDPRVQVALDVMNGVSTPDEAIEQLK